MSFVWSENYKFHKKIFGQIRKLDMFDNPL